MFEAINKSTSFKNSNMDISKVKIGEDILNKIYIKILWSNEFGYVNVHHWIFLFVSH